MRLLDEWRLEPATRSVPGTAAWESRDSTRVALYSRRRAAGDTVAAQSASRRSSPAIRSARRRSGSSRALAFPDPLPRLLAARPGRPGKDRQRSDIPSLVGRSVWSANSNTWNLIVHTKGRAGMSMRSTVVHATGPAILHRQNAGPALISFPRPVQDA